MNSNIEKEVYDFFINHYTEVNDMNGKVIINPPYLLMDDGIIILDEFFREFNVDKGYLDLNKYFNPVINPIQLL